jgi:hypothetical protein
MIYIILESSKSGLITNNLSLFREFRDSTKRRLRNRTRTSSEIEKEVHRGFVDWFCDRVSCHNMTHTTCVFLLQVTANMFFR